MTTLQELAERRASAAAHYRNLGMMNTYGRSPEDEIKASAAYRLAFDAMLRTESEYQDAIAKLSTEELTALANSTSV